MRRIKIHSNYSANDLAIKMLSLLLLVTTISATVLISSTTSADGLSETEVIDEVRLTVPVACTMAGTGTTHTATLSPGTYSGASGNEYENGIGKTTLTAICNDDNGFSIYAIGFTGNQYEGENHTKLVGTNTNGTIATKAYAAGDTTSNWSMKLTKVTNPGSGDPITYNPENLTITTNYDNWIAVPATYTKVAQYKANTGSSATDTTLGVKLETTYAAYVSSSQPADTYIGQVKYTMVHPYNHATPDEFTGETLQSVANWGSKVALGQTVTVSDARDGQEYTVARLADGKLWMTKNLRLDIGSANITVENTNNPSATFLAAASTSSSSDEWCTSSDSACTDQIKYNTSNIGNTTLDSDNHTYDEYGVYYNWYTATAGNGTYETTSNTTVAGDICPAGWHLPTGTVQSGSPNTWVGDFWKLAVALGGGISSDNNINHVIDAANSTRLRSTPNNFVYSGYFTYGGFSGLGTLAYYPSSMSKDNSATSRMLYLNDSSVTPGYSSGPTNNYGFTFRCLTDLSPYSFDSALADAGKTKHGGYYKMQDTDTSICSAVTEGEIGELIDERDDTIYKVGRLADGNCWMLNNLALDPTNPATAANMNSLNTNATEEAIANLLNGGSTNTGWSNTAVANVTSDFANPTLGYSTPRINNADKDTLVTGYGSASSNGQTKVGVYYNLCAATAGTICYSGGNSDAMATQDVCPARWRMPTAGSALSEYNNLSVIYSSRLGNDANSPQYNLSASLSGTIIGSSSTSQNQTGYYWSSMVGGGGADIAYFNGTNTFTSSRYVAYYGFPVRCILKY